MSEFITNDSGKRQEFSTGMKRDTNEFKARFDLIVPFDLPYGSQMLTRWADLMARGAVKYDARNWEKAETQEELDRFIDSAFRHFMQWLCGERGEDHAAAVFFNIQGAEYVRWRMAMNKNHSPLTMRDANRDLEYMKQILQK
jgi:hypothetical protein